MTHLKVFDEGRSQPNLEDIEIRSPCDVPWDSLRGNERVRTCGKCRENVYNISAMTRVEALRLIRAQEGRVCVRILRRPDGTVVTGECWSRLRAARRRGLLIVVGVLFVVGCVQLVAMLVGLRGLRNLVSGHQMGGVPAAAHPRAVPTIPTPRLEEPEMGELPPLPEEDGSTTPGATAPSAPHAKAARPKRKAKTIAVVPRLHTVVLGRMPLPKRPAAE